MIAAMKTLFKVVGVLLAIPVAILAICLTIFAVSVHFETQSKITAALESGFPGAEIAINDREDSDHANQVCFDVTVRPKSGRPTRRAIVMVLGDLDGGTWTLGSARYRSMRECKKDFFRG